MKHFLKISDCEPEELQSIMDLSTVLQNSNDQPLTKKNILFVFEKSSLRTKLGTEVAINHLGGNVIHIEADVMLTSGKAIPFSCRESMKDAMMNVSQWCDAVFARVYAHQTLELMAEHGEIPVVNALCNHHHPMQALADLYTIQQQYGSQKKVNITFIGDANNVAYSLIEIALKFGHEIRFTGPEKYYWNKENLDYFASLALTYGGHFIHTPDPVKAVKSTDVIYTDTFISMGEEHLYEEKIRHFQPYQVNGKIHSKAKPDTAFMHCLPAHRGVEVTDEVIDHPNSWVYKQAKNRMVVSKGVFAHLLA